jgi:4-amino-4-deoxy-L-arabinose transferase-like glycosyltransferase
VVNEQAVAPARHREWTTRLGDRAWLRRAALLLIAALAGLSYAWALNQDPLEPYYAAAVRSMSMSWHNFIYGAFDPAATITLDKLPGAFWIQALAVRAFGVHTWVIVAPQAIEGVLTVLFLYRAVQRLAGPTAGLIAAFIVAVSPATVALDRGNISDSLMILLLVLAADAVSSAIASGSQGRLILAAVWVGLAFQAKMIEAWMVIPAFGLAYLVDAPGSSGRRIRQLVVAGLVAGVVSVLWMTAVSLVPAAQRPYVDGSHHDSVYEQVFVYNGFGRFGEQTPLQLLAGQSLGINSVLTAPATGPDRLLRGDLGRDTGWLLPAALVIAVAGIASRRRRPRGDPLRSCFILWGGWLATLAVTFSLTTTINAYYTAALTPAVAAIVGAGVAAAWSPEHSRERSRERSPEQSQDRSGIGPRIALAVLVAGTAAYAAWLASTGANVPGWLVPAVIVVGLAAIVTVLGSLVVRSGTLWAAALAAGLVAGALAPAVAAASLVARDEGAFDTPFESATQQDGVDALFLQTPAQVKLLIPRLEAVQNGAPYLLATQTAAIASVFIYASGLEALPIGGFDGTIPSPTLAELQADVRAGKFHLVLAGTSTDPRIAWIAAHCLNAGGATSTLHNYYCGAGLP